MSTPDVISIQLYSLRNYGDLDKQLDAVSAAGYRHVETIQSHFEDAAGTRRKLDSRGLTASSGHIGLPALRERLDWVVEGAKTVGLTQLFMPALPTEERKGGGEHWRRAGQELGEFAARLADKGIKLGYHNHHWELEAAEDGRPVLAHFFDGANGHPLTWQVDVAWLARGGANPSEWLVKEKARVTSAHVKDIAPAGQKADEDGWTDVGTGTLDWPRLWRECRAAGAEWMVVEHDNPKHPDAFAKASFDFLKGLPA